MLYSVELSHRKLLSQIVLRWVPVIRGKEHNHYVFQIHLIKYTLADGALLSRSRHGPQRERGLRHSHQVTVLNNFKTRARCQFLPQAAVSRQTCQQNHQVQCIQDDHPYTGLQKETVTYFFLSKVYHFGVMNLELHFNKHHKFRPCAQDNVIEC